MVVGVLKEFQENFKVGIRINGTITDANGDYNDVPFLVLREVTRLDYINYCNEQSAMVANWEDINNPSTKFFEISVD